MYRSVAFLSVLISSGTWGAVTTVGFNSSAGSSFAPGQVISLTLEGSNFSQPLDGGGVNLNFNASVLDLQSVKVNTAVFDFAPSNGTINNVTGSVTGIDFNAFFNPSPTGTFDIATFQFVAEKAGNSNLTLSADSGNPFVSLGNTLVPGSDFSFGTSSVSVMVAPVPELPTTWLLVGGVIAALGMRRWMANKSTPHMVPAR